MNNYPYTSKLITKEQVLKIFEKLKKEKIKKINHISMHLIK